MAVIGSWKLVTFIGIVLAVLACMAVFLMPAKADMVGKPWEGLNSCGKMWESNHRVAKPTIVQDSGLVTHSGKNYANQEIFSTIGFWVREAGRGNKDAWGDFQPGTSITIEESNRVVRACVLHEIDGLKKGDYGYGGWYILSPSAKRH